MTKHVAEHHTCDLCQKECKPVSEVEVFHSFSGDGRNAVRFKVCLDMYYSNADDICTECVLKLLSDPSKFTFVGK